jgi:hypothetical protein
MSQGKKFNGTNVSNQDGTNVILYALRAATMIVITALALVSLIAAIGMMRPGKVAITGPRKMGVMVSTKSD